MPMIFEDAFAMFVHLTQVAGLPSTTFREANHMPEPGFPSSLSYSP
jgi:hypothetical protein